MLITASICTIGDEILIGQIVDTNSSMISRMLNRIGVKVVRMVSASDEENDIISTIKHCVAESDIVILTGGLGPTKDDITKKVLAKFTGSNGFVHNAEQYKVVERILKGRGIEISDINRDQAMVPDTCKVIVNECGTAPCMMFTLPDPHHRLQNGKLLFSMPGVPYESEAAMPKIAQEIIGHYSLDNIFHRTICTFGTAESTLAKQIEKWEDNLPDNMHLAYLPNPLLGVRLRLSIYGTEKEAGEKELDEQTEELKKIIGPAIYGYGETSLQATVGKLLKEKKATLSSAESCTGGKIASLITSIPGASEYFFGGVVSYDNSVKIKTLGVCSDTIEKYGAVSRECVEEMAKGVRKLMGTTYSIATSGIAGPGGGSEEKPVGLVWIAVCGNDFILSKEFKFNSPREINIARFASSALNMLRLQLEK